MNITNSWCLSLELSKWEHFARILYLTFLWRLKNKIQNAYTTTHIECKSHFELTKTSYKCPSKGIYEMYCIQNWLCKSRTNMHRYDISFLSEPWTSCITCTQFIECNKGMPWCGYLWCQAYSITCTNVSEILQSLRSQLALFSSNHTTFHQTTQQGNSIYLISDIMLWVSGTK